MQNSAQHFIWGGTLALGLQFLFIGSRVRFDKSYAWFGACLLLFSLLFFGDAWGLRNPSDVAGFARWTLLAHVAALALMPTLALFFFHVTGVFLRRGLAVFLTWDAVTALTLLSQSLVPGSAFRPGPSRISWYAFALLFCLVACGFLIAAGLGRKIRASEGAERRAFLVLAGGSAAVFIPGFLSAAAPALALPEPAPIQSLLGLGGFALAGVFVQTRRFLSLHGTNRDTMQKLADAYLDLHASSRLTDLGVSAASISHEIRNYVATLKGNAVLLNAGAGSSVRQAQADRIRVTADRMEAVSRDIALYSQASYPIPVLPIRLDSVVRDCVRLHFPAREGAFHIHSLPAGLHLAGNETKLEQVFVNMFKNALEAGSQRIDVRFQAWGDRLVVAVEDDGQGCPPEVLDRLALPFFSGKGTGGTGLGCAIAETILNAHGATMRAYSKIALGGGGSGLVLNLVFPIANGSAAGAGKDILVVSDDARTRSNMILPIVNLGLRPMLVPLEGGIRERKAPGAKTLFLDQAMAGRYFASGGPAPAVLVDRFRAASLTHGQANCQANNQAGTNRLGIGSEPGGRVVSAVPRETFLFSEENLAVFLVRSEAA
jgi:signal transduction histidine kinase